MSTRSLLSPMRLLITAAGLAVAIIGVLLLLNWWMVSCGRLACDVRPAWAAEASAPESCPPNIRTAATDTVWARGVYDNLPGWWPADPSQGRPRADKTTGWFFADGVATKTLISGQGSNADPDPLWRDAVDLLARTPGIEQPPYGATHPAASHSETKAAVWMRQSEVTYVVGVINNRRGPCGEGNPDDPYTCAAVIRTLLPAGSTMVIWWLSERDGRMVSVTYEGMAK